MPPMTTTTIPYTEFENESQPGEERSNWGTQLITESFGLKIRFRKPIRILARFILLLSSLYLVGGLLCWCTALRHQIIIEDFERTNGPCTRHGGGFFVGLMCFTCALFNIVVLDFKFFEGNFKAHSMLFVVNSVTAIVLGLYIVPTIMSATELSFDITKLIHTYPSSVTQPTVNNGTKDDNYDEEEARDYADLVKLIITWLMMLISIALTICFTATSVILLKQRKAATNFAKAFFGKNAPQTDSL